MLATTSTPTQAPAAYYRSLDGLRAVAVIMVFFQHYGAGHSVLFGWGWAGVDIFFVLSGFLITGILYDNRHQLRRYRDFYVRRTLRIFPLYYVVWGTILLLTPLALWQWDWRWGLWPAYLGNYARFFFHAQPGDPYRFDRLTFGPRVSGWFGYPVHLYIGHFWSLCVEEQFYLLWPFLVYQLKQRARLLWLCLAVVVASPLLRGWLSYQLSPSLLHLEFFYRSLPTRLDALLLGGLVALCLRGPEQTWVRRVRRPLLWLTVGLLSGLYLLSVKGLGLRYEGSASNWVSIFGFTLLDVAAAALILECIHPGSWLGRALSWTPLRRLGLVSYGFYVYHDLFHDFYAHFAHRYFPTQAYPMTLLVAFASTILLATLSYHLVEKPFLRLKDRFASQRHTAPTS